MIVSRPGRAGASAAWTAAAIPLHLWAQRTPAPSERAAPLDFLSAASLVQAEPQPLPPAPEDPVALVEALYAAARAGRVDHALQLLEAGADADLAGDVEEVA